MGGTRPPAWPSADERLVAAVRRGEAGAFERVYDRHARELHSFCRHMLGSSHDAEDALQQTFLKAYRALRRSGQPIALRPWLFTIARNECLTALRGRNPHSPVTEIGVTEGLAAQVEERAELRETLQDIAQLPDEQREALLLTSIQSLPGSEVAEILGTDRERVKALVYRARQSLAHRRTARDACCEDVRAQLSVLRGGSLRRKVIREHLLECEGCREFRLEVRRQRQQVAALLPVPLPLALKAASLPVLAAGGGKAAGVGGVGAGLTGLTAKVAVGVTGVAAVATAPALVAAPDRDPAGGTAGAAAAHAGSGEAPAGRGAAAETGTEPRGSTGKSEGVGGGSGRQDDGDEGPGPARGSGPRPDRDGAGSLAPENAAGDTVAGASSSAGPATQGPPPGHGGAPPGQGGLPPGLGAAPPGQGGIPPGQGGIPPGQGGIPPGQGGTPPGQAGTSPGQAGTVPGQGGTVPGQGTTPPGQIDKPQGPGTAAAPGAGASGAVHGPG